LKRRGLLIIDRGSKEQEAKDELEYISKHVKEKGKYDYCDYCFLEVVPPFIEEGIKKSLKNQLDELTIVPYFLYPGKKVKAAVTSVMKFQSDTKTKFLVTKPMSMHKTMIDLVDNRITSTLKENNQSISKDRVDVLIIGHGSKDPNAQISINYVVDGLKPNYRNVSYCFLEIEEPTIQQGIRNCKEKNPEILVIVFYFLHKGAHVKRDIYEELNPALEEEKIENTFITKHIGTDNMMIDLIIERAQSVEDAN
jgi:sirohydrochlorin ferrochelatase